MTCQDIKIQKNYVKQRLFHGNAMRPKGAYFAQHERVTAFREVIFDGILSTQVLTGCLQQQMGFLDMRIDFKERCGNAECYHY
jgi:hypothetical protein